MYKSTLVSQLNGNLLLFKDRSTQVKNSIYFNNSDDYLHSGTLEYTCLIEIGSDCGVFFKQKSNTFMSTLSFGKGTIHYFHESRALNGYLKGGYYI
jgi:hypothetical protein